MTQAPATKPLLCPHGYEVQIGLVCNLMWYAHPDKKGCDLLNRYNVTTEQVLLAIVGDTRNRHSHAVLFTAIACNPTVRVGYYQLLASLDGDKLKEALGVLGRWLPLLPSSGAIGRELEHVFGKVVWENMTFVNKGQNFYLSGGFVGVPLDSEREHLLTLPILDMENLKDNQMTRNALDIEEAVTKTKRFQKRY